MGTDPDSFDDGDGEVDLEGLGYRISDAKWADRSGSNLVRKTRCCC